MDGKENFKKFVKQNPNLRKYVQNGEMTWQKFYEMYDLYGEDSKVWNEYLGTTISTIGTMDVINWFKNIDIDSLQENVNSVKRVLGVLQDLGKNSNTKSDYKPRPLYQHFDD